MKEEREGGAGGAGGIMLLPSVVMCPRKLASQPFCLMAKAHIFTVYMMWLDRVNTILTICMYMHRLLPEQICCWVYIGVYWIKESNLVALIRYNAGGIAT